MDKFKEYDFVPSPYLRVSQLLTRMKTLCPILFAILIFFGWVNDNLSLQLMIGYFALTLFTFLTALLIHRYIDVRKQNRTPFSKFKEALFMMTFIYVMFWLQQWAIGHTNFDRFLGLTPIILAIGFSLSFVLFWLEEKEKISF